MARIRATRLGATLAATAVLAAAAGCSPTYTQYGYVPETPNYASELAVGADTRSTVVSKLGTPSTTSAFDGDAWYYITEVQARRAFLNPKTTNRVITRVRFDANDMVAAVDTFGLEKGRVVSINGDKTPTRGRELGVLEQLFGNVGRTPTQIGAEENAPGGGGDRP